VSNYLTFFQTVEIQAALTQATTKLKIFLITVQYQPSPVTILIDKNNWRKWNVLNIWVAR